MSPSSRMGSGYAPFSPSQEITIVFRNDTRAAYAFIEKLKEANVMIEHIDHERGYEDIWAFEYRRPFHRSTGDKITVRFYADIMEMARYARPESAVPTDHMIAPSVDGVVDGEIRHITGGQKLLGSGEK